jgi:hypothetical protein
MISRQKARRIAYGLVTRALESATDFPSGAEWDDADKVIIRDEMQRISRS